MLARLPAVGEDVVVIATRVLKGIGEDWHPVKGTVFVDAGGERPNIGRKPRRFNGDRAEGIAEDVPKDAEFSLIALSWISPFHTC